MQKLLLNLNLRVVSILLYSLHEEELLFIFEVAEDDGNEEKNEVEQTAFPKRQSHSSEEGTLPGGGAMTGRMLSSGVKAELIQ